MREDRELKEYRDLLKPPEKFEEGFDWKTIVGAVFIGFLMMPGSMYLQLVIGTGIGPGRALGDDHPVCGDRQTLVYTELKQQEIFLLYYMAGRGVVLALFRACCGTSTWCNPMRPGCSGLTEFIPTWVAPSLGLPIPGGADFFSPRLADRPSFCSSAPRSSNAWITSVSATPCTASPPTWSGSPSRWPP